MAAKHKPDYEKISEMERELGLLPTEKDSDLGPVAATATLKELPDEFPLAELVQTVSCFDAQILVRLKNGEFLDFTARLDDRLSEKQWETEYLRRGIRNPETGREYKASEIETVTIF